MSYSVYLDGILLPVTPSKLSLKINNQNKTLSLINGEEVNILNPAGLTDISFSCLLPQQKYPFARYPDGFKKASEYLGLLERLKTDGKPFIFSVIRENTAGGRLFDTVMRVALEEYDITEDSEKYGTDISADIKLKQWRSYSTKEIELYNQTQHSGAEVTMGVVICRRESDRSTVKQYTVQLGDALYTIAKAVYGDAMRYTDIYEANKALIDKGNRGTGQTRYMIYPGQVLTIP